MAKNLENAVSLAELDHILQCAVNNLAGSPPLEQARLAVEAIQEQVRQFAIGRAS